MMNPLFFIYVTTDDETKSHVTNIYTYIHYVHAHNNIYICAEEEFGAEEKHESDRSRIQ